MGQQCSSEVDSCTSLENPRVRQCCHIEGEPPIEIQIAHRYPRRTPPHPSLDVERPVAEGRRRRRHDGGKLEDDAGSGGGVVDGASFGGRSQGSSTASARRRVEDLHLHPASSKRSGGVAGHCHAQQRARPTTSLEKLFTPLGNARLPRVGEDIDGSVARRARHSAPARYVGASSAEVAADAAMQPPGAFADQAHDAAASLPQYVDDDEEPQEDEDRALAGEDEEQQHFPEVIRSGCRSPSGHSGRGESARNHRSPGGQSHRPPADQDCFSPPLTAAIS